MAIWLYALHHQLLAIEEALKSIRNIIPVTRQVNMQANLVRPAGYTNPERPDSKPRAKQSPYSYSLPPTGRQSRALKFKKVGGNESNEV